MMKESESRSALKGRIKEWSRINHRYGNGILFDAAILETFFFVYNNLERGQSIHDIGFDLGVLPLP